MGACVSRSVWRMCTSSAAHNRHRTYASIWAFSLIFISMFCFVFPIFNEFDDGTARLKKRYPHGCFVTCHPCTARALLSLHNTCMIARFGTDYPKMFSCLSMRHYSMLTTSRRIKYLISMSRLKTSLNHLLSLLLRHNYPFFLFFPPSNHTYLHVRFRNIK